MTKPDVGLSIGNLRNKTNSKEKKGKRDGRK